MRWIIIATAMATLGACGSSPPGVSPSESGGSRADGIVTMTSTRTIYNAVGPDWEEAEAGAEKRCRTWGFEGAGAFSGWQDTCLGYDRHGRCLETATTQFYACDG